MHLFKSMGHFELFLLGREKPSESILLNKYTSSTYDRAQYVSCNCVSSIDLGEGLKCLDRRVKGNLEIDWENYDNDTTIIVDFLGGCSVTYEMEASSVFQKKVFGIWWNTSADQIKVAAEWSIFNNRGGNDENICSSGPLSRSLSNNSNVQLRSRITCTGNWSPGRGPCKDERDLDTNGIRSASSTHTAKKDGKCNSSNLICSKICI